MKKYFILSLLIACSSYTWGQTQFGLHLSPTITTNRVSSSIDSLAISENGVGLRFIAGIYADRFLGGNAHFSTGIYYLPKRISYEIVNKATQTISKETYNLQYIQLPATLRMMTGEITLDTRLFFNVGTALDIKIHDDHVQNNESILRKIRNFDAALVLGAGIEKRISTSTNIYGGFTYRRGLLNTVAVRRSINSDIEIKNDLFSVDLMIRF